MWGPGAIIHIINILPFAGPFLWTLNFKRYSWLQNNPFGNRRNYNRRWWVRVFFGRFNLYVFAIFGSYYLMTTYFNHRNSQIYYNHFTTYLEQDHRFDEEESVSAHKMLAGNLYHDKRGETKEMLKKFRAERDHQLKTAAFKEYENHYDSI